MSSYIPKFAPIKEAQSQLNLKEGDTVVIFGEVFSRGYVNGVIDEAKSAGAQVIYSTVGRRDSEGQLRPLNGEELSEKDSPLINVPLEAGFDLENPVEKPTEKPTEKFTVKFTEKPDNATPSVIEQLKPYGLRDWNEAKLDWDAIEKCRQEGEKRFRTSTLEYLSQLKPYLDLSKKVIFVHTMAGGFPRAKVVMPIANRIFKGSGARFQSSKEFWDSEIGKLCALSFQEVTAETYRHLIELTRVLREDAQKQGGEISYMAYGYHGNEVLIKDQYTWYSYSPYLQGWAKLRLEEISYEAYNSGLNSTVFNVPEILTNSSSIFLGIEVVLYPLLKSLIKEGGDHPKVKELLNICESKLSDGASFENISKLTEGYLSDPKVLTYPKFETWPQHNDPEQMEKMVKASSDIIALHKDSKALMTSDLSEIIFKSTGKIMLREMTNKSRGPALWIGHDMVSKTYLKSD